MTKPKAALLTVLALGVLAAILLAIGSAMSGGPNNSQGVTTKLGKVPTVTVVTAPPPAPVTPFPYLIRSQGAHCTVDEWDRLAYDQSAQRWIFCNGPTEFAPSWTWAWAYPFYSGDSPHAEGTSCADRQPIDTSFSPDGYFMTCEYLTGPPATGYFWYYTAQVPDGLPIVGVTTA